MRRVYSEQAALGTRSPETAAVQLPFFGIQPIDFAIFFILLVHQFGDISFPAHPGSKSGVIHFSVMRIFDHMPDLIGAVRKIFQQPVMKKKFDGAIQTDKCIS